MRKLSDTLNLYIVLLTEKQCLILLGDRPTRYQKSVSEALVAGSPVACEKVVKGDRPARYQKSDRLRVKQELRDLDRRDTKKSDRIAFIQSVLKTSCKLR